MTPSIRRWSQAGGLPPRAVAKTASWPRSRRMRHGTATSVVSKSRSGSGTSTRIRWILFLRHHARMRITGVDFIYVPCTDFEASSRFYSEVLGLAQSKRYGKMPGGGFETGTLTVQLLQAEAFGQQFNRSPNPIALHVDDVEQARK